MIAVIKNVFTKATRLTYKNIHFLLLFWVTNFALAFALSMPLYSLLRNDLRNSILNSHLGGDFDFLWFSQFLKLNDKTVSSYPGLILIVVLIYNIIQVFFSGGLISVLSNSSKNHSVDFFYGGVKYFFRYLKIFLVAIALYFLAIMINLALEKMIFLIVDVYSYAALTILFDIIKNAFLLFLISTINIVSDYTKIAVCQSDLGKVYPAFKKALLFLRTNFKNSLVIFLICAVFVALGALTYNLIDNVIPKTTAALIIVTFFIQQLLVIFRFLIKILFYATEVVFYSESDAQVIDLQSVEINPES